MAYVIEHRPSVGRVARHLRTSSLSEPGHTSVGREQVSLGWRIKVAARIKGLGGYLFTTKCYCSLDSGDQADSNCRAEALTTPHRPQEGSNNAAMELTPVEAVLLRNSLEQTIGALEDSKSAMTEDRTLPDVETLLEVTASADEQIVILRNLIKRMDEENG